MGKLENGINFKKRICNNIHGEKQECVVHKKIHEFCWNVGFVPLFDNFEYCTLKKVCTSYLATLMSTILSCRQTKVFCITFTTYQNTLINKSIHIHSNKFSAEGFWNRSSLNVGRKHYKSSKCNHNKIFPFFFFIKTQSSCQPVFGTSRSLSIKFFEDGNKKLDGQTFCSSPKAIPARLFFCWTVLAHSLWKAKRHYYELFGIWEGLLYPS